MEPDYWSIFRFPVLVKNMSAVFDGDNTAFPINFSDMATTESSDPLVLAE